MMTVKMVPPGWRSESTSTEKIDRYNSVGKGLPTRQYRPELHGVRGLAILGVVLFHLFGAGRISGGIDVFLAITGFLFTTMLLREATENSGRIDLLRYFGRLVRRILAPAALVVIVVTAVGLMVFPVTRHAQLWAESRASLLYFENVELINSQLAYGAAGPETSPFQHFWSLSVQGQFYLMWPVAAIAAVLVARRLHVPSVRVMAVIVGVMLATSLVYALYVGGFNQDEAYLLTTTRMWQLAFGGVLGLLGASLKLPRRFRMPVGWLGVALITTCGFVLDGAELFPGLWSFWPLMGLALVLASAGPDGGQYDPTSSATRFLSTPMFSWIGDHAYALYLWHWPALIFYLEIRDREAIGIRGGLFILCISMVLAWLTHRLLETPLKNAQVRAGGKRLRTLNKVTISIAIMVLAVGGITSSSSVNAMSKGPPTFGGWDWETYPGGSLELSESGQMTVPEADYVPSLEELPSVHPDYYTWGCKQPSTQAPGSDETLVCEDPDAPEDPTATVVLAGGSHAGHWATGFRTLAEEYGWELLLVDRSSCPFGDPVDPEDILCESWQDNYIEWLGQERDIDVVVTPGTRMDPNGGPENILPGAQERWQQITDTGAELLLMRGTPRGFSNVSDCLAGGSDPAECGPPTEQIKSESLLETVNLPERVSTIDVVDHVCPAVNEGAEHCNAVVGNVVVWHDGHHLTNTFTGTMAPVLDSHMRDEVGWLFPR